MLGLLDAYPLLTVVVFGVGEGVLGPVHVGGAVADGVGKDIEGTQAGHVRVAGVGLPQLPHGDVAPIGPEVVAVDVHAYSDAAEAGDQFFAAGELAAHAGADVAVGARSGGLPGHAGGARLLRGDQHLGERLGDQGVDLLGGVGLLGPGLARLVCCQIERCGVVDDRAPRQVRPGSRPQFPEPVRRGRREHQHVAVQPRTAFPLRQDPLRQRHRRRVLVTGRVGGIRRQDHQSHAVVVVGHVAGRIGEHLHRGEAPPVALAIEPPFDFVVGVAVGVVGRGPVGGHPGDVGLQGVPVLVAVHVQVRRLARQPLQRVGELAGRLAGLHAPQHHRAQVYAPLGVGPGRRAHVDRAGGAPGGRQAPEVRRVVVDPQRQGVRAVHVGLDDRVPALFQVFLHLTHERAGVHRQVGGHDQQ